MEGKVTKTIEIPEITRVEGHAAVEVDIVDGKVDNVKLDVFEGTRFFEKIVVGHKFYEIPHITSRVCAICSAGHVLAAIFAVEPILGIRPSRLVTLLRELMHLGMIIESHSTHIFALALPDFVGVHDLLQFATQRPNEFQDWTELRKLGSFIQTVVGGRPFHPVNLQAGGFSRYPSNDELQAITPRVDAAVSRALSVAEFLLSLKIEFSRTTVPTFLALIPEGNVYGYFGRRVRASDGWESDISNYGEYLDEKVVAYSHAKRSTFKGKPLMVGSMARLSLYSERLTGEAANLYQQSALARGDSNTVLNNLAQAIELVQALDRVKEIIEEITSDQWSTTDRCVPDVRMLASGFAVGAVECPRGTLYHSYELDQNSMVVSADLITPSAQNTARIELDIREVVQQQMAQDADRLQAQLETLIRAYDPCNTCATHMVQLKYKEN